MGLAISARDHLVRQGAIWYFRFIVPSDLRIKLGRTEIRRSLRTGFRSEAKPKAMRLASTMYLIVNEIRSGAPPMADLTDTQIQHLVEKWIRRELDRFEECLLAEPRWSQSAHENYMDGYGELLLSYGEQLDKRNYAKVAPKAEELLKAAGLEVDNQSAAFSKLCHSLLRAGVETCGIVRNRLNDDYSDPYAIQITPTPPPVMATARGTGAETGCMINLSDIMTAWIASKEHWPPTTKDQYRNYIKTFIEVVGDIPIGSLTKDHVREYGESLRRLPKRRTVLKRYRDLSMDQLRRMNIPEEDKLSPTTVKDSFVGVRAFLKWAEGNFDGIPSGLGGPLDPPRVERDPSLDKAEFDDEDLKLIFHGPDYMNDDWAPEYAARFWLPLLMLFTGARNEEMAQLYVSDINQKDGLWYFDINDDEDKRLKTKASRRFLPIHPRLLDIGLLHYVERMKAEGHKQLFPHLERNKRGKIAHKVNVWFNRTYKKKVGLVDGPEGKKTIYSFRHTFTNKCFKMKYDLDCRRIVAGRAAPSLTQAEGHYVKARRDVRLLYDEVISKIDFNLDLSHLKNSMWVK